MRQHPTPSKHTHITRIDHPSKHSHGYNVRIAWQGIKHGRFFSDERYSGPAGALEAAIW